MMDNAAILAKVDHTLLKPEATWADIKKLCDEAMEYHTASVCINPCFVKQAAEYMKGAVPVCTVVGFPLGATDTATKVFDVYGFGGDVSVDSVCYDGYFEVRPAFVLDLG